MGSQKPPKSGHSKKHPDFQTPDKKQKKLSKNSANEFQLWHNCKPERRKKKKP
jgi:hypothetical protein